MSHEILVFFSQLIEKETGIHYSESNLYQLSGRIDEFCKKLNIDGPHKLYEIFSASLVDQKIKSQFVDLATNNETSFFRDPVYFKAIEQYVTDHVTKSDSELRIWSAASSTGQEAISIAIMLEELSKKIKLPPYQIMATDISHEALKRGEMGVYSDFELMRGISPERREQFFTQTPLGWQVKPYLHSKMRFAHNNLLHSSVSGPFDLIFCRNVLIYQRVEIKRNILTSILRQLKPEGGLVLGVGETLFGVTENMMSTIYGGVIIYKNHPIKITA